jgi:hypothetical protein
MDEWREGARSGDPEDKCPGCGRPGPIVVFDFKKMGKHRCVVCTECTFVYVDGKPAQPLIVTPKAI